MSYQDKDYKTTLEWLSTLNVDHRPSGNYRRTSIICTIGWWLASWDEENVTIDIRNLGPKTNSVEMINKLRKCTNAIFYYKYETSRLTFLQVVLTLSE